MKVSHSVWLIPPRLTLGQSIYIHNWKDKKWNLIFGHFSPEPHQLLTQRAKPITSGEKILEQVISGSTSRMTATTSNTPTSPSSSMVDTCSPQFPSILDYKDRYRPLPQVKLHIFWSGSYPLDDRAIYGLGEIRERFHVFDATLHYKDTKMSIAWKKKYLSGWDGPRQVRDGLPRGRQEEWDLLCQQACQVQVEV